MRLSNILKRSIRTIKSVDWDRVLDIGAPIFIIGGGTICIFMVCGSVVRSCNASEAAQQRKSDCVDTTILTYPDGDAVALTCNVDIKAVRSHIDTTLNKPLSQENANHLLLMKKGIEGRGY